MRLLLLSGSNLGDRRKMLQTAVAAVSLHLGRVVAVSSIYETAPWGNQQQDLFLNQALMVETEETDPLRWLKAVKDAEQACGRTPSERWGPREIDLDILLAGDLVFQSEQLQIPHPRMQERKFCLMPAAEIAAEWIHPGYQRNLKELLAKCTDPLSVGIYIGPADDAHL